MFSRPPEDDAIPVLTEILNPTAAPAEDLQAIADEARRDFRADPMSIDFAAELIPMPVDAPATSTEMPFPPAAIAHQTQLPPATTVPYVEPVPDPTLPPPSAFTSTIATTTMPVASQTIAATVPVPPLADPGGVPSATIPVLTSAMAGGMPYDAAPVTQTQRLALLPDIDLIALEERLRDSVLARLHPRIDPMLDERIEMAMHEVFEAELPGLRNKLHAALSETLQDVVSRAISKELAKIYSARAQKN